MLQTSSKETKPTNNKVLRVWQAAYFWLLLCISTASPHIWLSLWTASPFPPLAEIRMHLTKIFLSCPNLTRRSSEGFLHLYIKCESQGLKTRQTLLQHARIHPALVCYHIGMSLHPIHGPNNCFCKRLITSPAQR